MHPLASRLPELPRWIEARDLLLHGSPEITGLSESPELSFVMRDPATHTVFVIGRPEVSAVRAAMALNRKGADLLAPWSECGWLAAALPEIDPERAVLHLLERPELLDAIDTTGVRYMEEWMLETLDIDAELLDELRDGTRRSPIAARFVDGRPVAFCYAGAITEKLWDVAIDTVEGYRRRGYAAACAAFLIREMKREGRDPVWGALASNPASWRLALKIGFVEVDELVLFQAPLGRRGGAGERGSGRWGDCRMVTVGRRTANDESRMTNVEGRMSSGE